MPTLSNKLFVQEEWEQMWDTNLFVKEKKNIESPHMQVIELISYLFLSIYL